MSNLGKYQDITTEMAKAGGVDEYFKEHDEKIREECRKSQAKGFIQGSAVTIGGIALLGIKNKLDEHHGRKLDKEWQEYLDEREREEKLRESKYRFEESKKQYETIKEQLEEQQKRLISEKNITRIKIDLF